MESRRNVLIEDPTNQDGLRLLSMKAGLFDSKVVDYCCALEKVLRLCQ